MHGLFEVHSQEIGNERVVARRKNCFFEVTRLSVVSAAKTHSWHDGEPSEISVRIEKLMERIDPQCAVILKVRTACEVSVKIGQARFPLVKNWPTKKRGSLNVEHDFGEPLGCFEEAIGLKSPDGGERINRIRFRDREHIIRLRVELEFAWIKILQQELVA